MRPDQTVLQTLQFHARSTMSRWNGAMKQIDRSAGLDDKKQ